MFDTFTTETKKTYKLETYTKSHNFDNEEEEQKDLVANNNNL